MKILVMETQRRNAYMIHRPRIQEDRETVRRQQKELRRVRQRERRQKMTIEQIEKQRECARQYYLRRKNQQPMKLTERTDELRMDPCRTVVEIKQFIASDLAYRSQQRGNLEAKRLMEQADRKNMAMDGQNTNVIVESKTNRLNRHKNRLTHVKREARSKVNRASGNENVRSPRLTHIRRQARGLSRGVVGESNKYGMDAQKHGNSLDKNGSFSIIQDHAQILVDISRMNRCSSTSIANCSEESMETDLNMKAADDQLDPCEDTGEFTSDSEEVLAFLSGLSAKRSISRA